jgi:hypothetical protein
MAVYCQQAMRKSPPIVLEGSRQGRMRSRATKPDMRQSLVPGQLCFLGQRRSTIPRDQSRRIVLLLQAADEHSFLGWIFDRLDQLVAATVLPCSNLFTVKSFTRSGLTVFLTVAYAIHAFSNAVLKICVSSESNMYRSVSMGVAASSGVTNFGNHQKSKTFGTTPEPTSKFSKNMYSRG